MSALAQVLEEREAEILQAWMARVRQHLMAESRTQAELEDHLPLLLRRLQAALRDGTSLSDPASSRSGTQGVGREHGAQRFRLGFELGMLVREYGLLSDVLLELIIREGLQVPLQDVRRMSHFMSMAVAEAVEEHSRQETEQARAAVLDALAVQSLVGVSYLRGPEHVTQMAN
ncbi:MAG: RsbRD N-terminal domain-containing protein, partial [Cystobacter sp.]